MEWLQAWVNEEVGLSQHVTSLESQFANGFLFAELPHRHGRLQSFTEAGPSPTARRRVPKWATSRTSRGL
jgi:hypothetical protein